MMLECSDCGKTIAALKGWTASLDNSALCTWCLGERVFESSGKDGGSTANPAGNLDATDPGLRKPGSLPAPVPANPAAGSEVHPPIPPGGGGHFSPDDGTPLQFGDPLEEGPKLRYYAGPCYVCGRAAITGYKPRPGTSGQHRCFPCFREARR